VAGLRKVLELERTKKFANSAVIGGLDAYFRRYLEDNPQPSGQRLQEVLRLLPDRGYMALHPIQRRRVVEELLATLDEGIDSQGELSGQGVKSSTGPSSIPSSSASRPASTIGTLNSPVTIYKGVSRANAAKLTRLGVQTVGDLLFHFPYRYNDFAQVRPINQLLINQEQTLVANVWSASATNIGRKKGTEAIVGDETGTIPVIWWGQTYIARQLRSGMQVALSGRVTVFRGRRQMENPEWEPIGAEGIHTGRLVPMYPSTEGLSQRLLRRLAKEAVDSFADQVADPLPNGLRQRLDLLPIADALRQIHFPDSWELAEASRRRFAFEELLYVQLGVLLRRQLWQVQGQAASLSLPEAALAGFISSLPFQLTNAQRRAINDVLRDVARDVPMSRLLQGDVGSGKTVVALAALLAAVASGYQGAIMAPTEILAEQHCRTLSSLLSGGQETLWTNVYTPPYLDKQARVALLIGSLTSKEKEAAQDAIARGETDIAIGTQALIQGSVSFPRLGLIVVDEQHRFGVLQRAALREKADAPAHVLVMTATPIPRTLALTVYGDLDISVMEEMPPGRPPVKTHHLRPDQRQKAYDFVRRQVAAGRQAYIICPLVEESEAVVARAAVQEYERLYRHVFPDLRLGLLHGRLPPAEKDAVMRAFRDGQLDVLVSTAVVEVGIDVPNATVMLVEGADRFGLAQLHQFRGRVRRSEQQAYCLLLSENPSIEAQERLRLLETVHDGFQLAEEDLRLRGPGEFFGTRQSGLPDLRVAKLSDVALIEEARSEAARLLEDDPDLSRPQHRALAARVAQLWEHLTAEVS